MPGIFPMHYAGTSTSRACARAIAEQELLETRTCPADILPGWKAGDSYRAAHGAPLGGFLLLTA